MSNPIRKPAELEPRGPEGVPVDAPDNEGPAISPLTPSRMHRAEDDATAVQNSPDFSDHGSRKPNPSHGTAKDASTTPKGRGDGEMRDQPATQSEARQRGADNPKFDE